VISFLFATDMSGVLFFLTFPKAPLYSSNVILCTPASLPLNRRLAYDFFLPLYRFCSSYRTIMPSFFSGGTPLDFPFCERSPVPGAPSADGVIFKIFFTPLLIGPRTFFELFSRSPFGSSSFSCISPGAQPHSTNVVATIKLFPLQTRT